MAPPLTPLCPLLSPYAYVVLFFPVFHLVSGLKTQSILSSRRPARPSGYISILSKNYHLQTYLNSDITSVSICARLFRILFCLAVLH
jgi:hypothetical protein